MTQFETNKTYAMKFIGDSELVVPVTILKRTAKSVTIKLRGEAEKRCKIYDHDGCEYILPEGKYSMAPSCYAKRPM